MYIEIGFLGHVLSITFGPAGGDDEAPVGISGGAGGQFERFIEPEEEADWEWEEERHRGFGFG